MASCTRGVRYKSTLVRRKRRETRARAARTCRGFARGTSDGELSVGSKPLRALLFPPAGRARFRDPDKELIEFAVDEALGDSVGIETGMRTLSSSDFVRKLLSVLHQTKESKLNLQD